MPSKGHASCIEYDTEDDELVKVLVHGNGVTCVFYLVASDEEFLYRLILVAVDEDFTPIQFHLSEQMIHFQVLFFITEHVDNDTDKHIQDEQMEEEDDQQEEDYCHTEVSINNWNFLNLVGVESCEHNVYPSFGGHHIE